LPGWWYWTALRSGAALRTRPEWLVGRTVVYPGTTHGLKRQSRQRAIGHTVSFTEWAWENVELADILPFPRVTATAALKALRLATGIGGWEWHDVRRSFRSWSAKAGVSRDAAETVLGHVITKSEVDRAYLHYRFGAESEAAFHAWQRHVQRLVEGDVAAKVVPLR
jgi:hypothetical protein